MEQNKPQSANEIFQQQNPQDGTIPPWAEKVCNERVRQILKYALQVAAEKTLIDRKPTGEGESSEEYTASSFEGDLGYEDYIPVEYTVNKQSILSLEKQILKDLGI